MTLMDYKAEVNRIFSCAQLIPDALLKDKPVDSKGIFLYGSGDLGHLALTLMKRAGYPRPAYIVDAKKRGTLDGVRILSPDEIPSEDREQKLCLVCICTLPYNQLTSFLKRIGIRHICQFYTWAYFRIPRQISNGWMIQSSIAVRKNVEVVAEALEHEPMSLCHYLQFLWWKMANIEHIYEEVPVLSGKKYFSAPCIREAEAEEVLLDCGAHYGQTIEKFLAWTHGKYKKVIALEPDAENLRICQAAYHGNRIQYHNFAVDGYCGYAMWESGLGYSSKLDDQGTTLMEVRSIDSLHLAPTIIKLHIEGAELRALYGAKWTLMKYHPIVMCMADHSNDALTRIPMFLMECGYKLFFYLHDYCGNSAVWYGIPDTEVLYATL